MAVSQLLVADRYRLRQPVGVGGMGRVWLARDEMLDRDVAVKEFVPPEWMNQAERDRLGARTLREARSAARLNHPHVVRIYDVVHAFDQPWIVMEYVPSRSLHQVITEDGPVAPQRAALIGLAVLDALAAAHRAGVLHRDVKPHNVLIGHDGRVVLTDFGLATFVDDGLVTGPGMVVGSPQFVSPERARAGASTVESDLWSFGATLHATVEGRSPYARESAMATLMALATEPPDPPVRAGPLAEILAGLLRHDPAERITAAEAEQQLRRVIGGGVVPHPRTPAQLRPPTARPGAPAAGRACVPAPRSAPHDSSTPPPSALPESAPLASAPPVPRPAEAATGHRWARSRLVVVGAVLGALLAGGAAVTGWISGRGDDRVAAPPAGVGTPTSQPSSTAGGQAGGFSPIACAGQPSATLPRTPLPGTRRPPASGYALLPGWSYHHVESGLFVAVPDGWTYEQVRSTLCFREPGGARVLSIDTARKPSADPVVACRTEAQRLTRAGVLPGYAEVGIRPVPYVSRAADWEYRYRDAEGNRLHATTRWFASGPKAYALSWMTREFDWQTNRAHLAMIQASVTSGG